MIFFHILRNMPRISVLKFYHSMVMDIIKLWEKVMAKD